MFFGIIVLIVVIVSYYGNGGSSIHGGGGYVGVRGSGGFRGGSGCFSEDTLVWTKNDTRPDTTARRIPVRYLQEGHLVSTMDLDRSCEEHQETAWTRSTDVTTYMGHFRAHTFTLATGHRLTVTSPHIMIIWKNKIPYFLRADHVMVGDEMRVQDIITQVTMIETKMVGSKVAIETEDGTIQVNGVLASGFCDDNSDTMNKVMKVQPMIENYKYNHFGEIYNSMCMDAVAWKTNLMINNGVSS